MASRSPSWKSTTFWLGFAFVLALALRIAFNMGVAYDAEGERYLYSGNDPWYHDRAVEHILETGESLQHDPAIAYPEGGPNPNPPIYDWVTAVDAQVLDWGGVVDAVGLALNLAVGFWGALTIFPVFMIAKDLWGRRAGLWAAFFMGVSAPHISRTVFGFADHDAMTMFWIVASFAFLLKALQSLKRQEFVPSWKAGAMDGIRRSLGENRIAMLWAALSGTALAATALTWKGYPYALAVIALAFGLQLLWDHVKNKDSTGIAFAYLIPVVLTLVISLPYYLALGFADSTVMPNLYVLLGMLVVGVILVPTRELPSILVFPGLVVAAGLGLLAMLLIVPEVGRTIFTGLGYFEQTKLFSTIAEAQRTELGFVAANFGFFTFLLGLWAFGRSVRLGWKGQEAHVFMASWAIIAGFMAFAAGRFIMNAAPVFAVFSGAATAWILTAAGIDKVRERRRAGRGQGNPIGNLFKSVDSKAVLATLGVLVLLVVPNVWIGVDAGMSSDFEREHGLDQDRIGAFGISFSIKENGWLPLFDHLATLDTELPMADRCAFIAWWDYGHWATAIGQHPTVADPFQNHFVLAGRFLASESEEEATNWLTVLLLNGELRSHGKFSDELMFTLNSFGVDGDQYAGTLEQRYALLDAATAAGHISNDAFALYDGVADTVGKKVCYFGVDSRMWPADAFNSGIFYAPAYLANKNPDDFLQFTYIGQGLQITLTQYEVDANGNSIRLPEPEFRDQDGNEWIVLGQQAFPAEPDPYVFGFDNERAVTVQPNLQPTARFRDTMYAKAYGDISALAAPGDGLTHWRAVFQQTNTIPSSQGDFDFRQTALLQYYRGYNVQGHLLDETGQPMSGTVTFVDGFGAAHMEVEVDETGAFHVLAPFGDDLELTVRSAGSPVYSEPWTVTKEQAMGATAEPVTLRVAFGDVAGRIFRDVDGDNQYNASTDEIIAGARLTIADRTITSSGDGTYRFNDLQAGSYRMQVRAAGYENLTRTAVVTAGDTVVVDGAPAVSESQVTVSFLDGGEAQAGIPVNFDGPESEVVTTSSAGTGLVDLQPGTYTVTVDHTFEVDGVETSYQLSQSYTVPFGGAPQTLVLRNS